MMCANDEQSCKDSVLCSLARHVRQIGIPLASSKDGEDRPPLVTVVQKTSDLLPLVQSQVVLTLRKQWNYFQHHPAGR
jgi:hypothetical protein